MVQVMLGGIEPDFSEGYSPAAGLFLGFITLGQGDDDALELEDSKILRIYINGRRTLSSSQ